MDPFSMMMAANAGLSLLNGINQYQNNNGMYGGGVAGGMMAPSLMSSSPLTQGFMGGGLMAIPSALGYDDLSQPFGKKSPLNFLSPPLFLANLFK